MKIYTFVGMNYSYAGLTIKSPDGDETAFQVIYIQKGKVENNGFMETVLYEPDRPIFGKNNGKKVTLPLGDFVDMVSTFYFSQKVTDSFFGKYLTSHYKVHKIRVLIDGGEVSYYMPIIPRLSGIFNEEKSEIERYPISKGISKIVKYYFNDSAIDNNVQLFGLTELNGRILLHSSSPVHSSLFWHIQKEKYTGMKLHEIYRTKGEPDYDIEATLKAWEQNPNLIDPIYVKQSFMEKWF